MTQTTTRTKGTGSSTPYAAPLKTTVNVDELRREFQDLPERMYSYDRQNDQMKYIRSHYAVEEFTVAVGGYKIVVAHVGTFLLFARARATSVQRGHLILDLTTAKTDRRDTINLMGATYYWDCWGGPMKYHAAMQLLIAAWFNAQGNREALYKALGKSGYCAICGASLTDDLSTQRGIGPECWRKVYVNMEDVHTIQKRRITKNS